jgi:bleomycin hydrolase
MTPQEYATDYLKLPLNDYVALMSTRSVPFWTQGEYKVPDNWWHSKDYYNVPLRDFYKAIRNAVKNGYSLVFGGDISEPGKVPEEDVAIVPTFDIPGKFINQDAREFRFYNHTTTDDHGIHAVGFAHKYGHDWFLIKDSGRSSRKGKLKGYYIFRDDYVRLKMLTVLVHKDAVAELMAKYAKMHARTAASGS